MRFKLPVSVLVIVHTPDLRVLLLERADFPEHWQCVTGSREEGETFAQTARRELMEETGIDALRHGDVRDWEWFNDYEIFPQWRHRYASGTTHNREHAFSVEVPQAVPVRLAPREHTAYLWLPWHEAAPKCFSWSNRAAIEQLPQRIGSKAASP
jgi:dihydroneopterin triphosphate diphosphatase